MIVIVGAGLAGLTCAKVLAEAGQPFLLCEAADEPGGRVRSRITREGFVLDEGFQVLLDSYPAARRHLDLAALRAGKFASGAMLVGHDTPRLMVNPLRSPRQTPAMLIGSGLGLSNQLRFGRLILEAFSGADDKWNQCSVREMLQRFGFSESFVRKFAQPFFGGVLLDPELDSRAGLLMEYLRRFVTGTALLPASGMGTLGRQLASRLPAESICYRARVGELMYRGEMVAGVTLADGEVIRADAVVLAVDEPDACRMLKIGAPRAARGTAVHYFRSRRPFYVGAWLCLPERSAGSPILHAALVTNVTPSLAPVGEHLWSVTVLPDHPAAREVEKIRAEVAGWFRARPVELMPLEFVEVPYALPDQSPGVRSALADAVLPKGVLVAGDAIDQASIDGVIAGGEAVARRIIASVAAT